jgi:hypothetical protein
VCGLVKQKVGEKELEKHLRHDNNKRKKRYTRKSSNREKNKNIGRWETKQKKKKRGQMTVALDGVMRVAQVDATTVGCCAVVLLIEVCLAHCPC